MAIRKGKKTPVAPKAKTAKVANVLFEKKTRNFGIGGHIQPVRDMGRYVKWPKYVRLQRQKAVLLKRLKVPPSLNQFTKTLDKHTASEFFKLATKYRPESKQQKKERLLALAAAKNEGKEIKQVAPIVLKKGLNHITALIEAKNAKLVVIAHDVDPIELVVWLPALCRKAGVPYCIVKGKARLGALVHNKTATALAFTDVRPADRDQFNKLLEAVTANFTNKWDEDRKHWGGGELGNKSMAKRAKVEKAKARELAAKM